MERMKLFIGMLIVTLVGCSAVVGDYEAVGCDPEVPSACGDLGDEEAQHAGCCTEEDEVYYCRDGRLEHITCAETQICDYNVDAEAMGCVD